MTAPALDILGPLYAAVTGSSAIADKLGSYNGAASVHTRRPVPDNAEYPMIAIGPVAARTDEDGTNDSRPVIAIDVTAYGTQGAVGTGTDQYRIVEEIGDLIFGLFHRRRGAIVVDNYSVVDIRATGPSPAPVDDETHVGRRVSLTIRLSAQ